MKLSRFNWLVLLLFAAVSTNATWASTYESHQALWCDQETIDTAFQEIGDGILDRAAHEAQKGASLLAISGGGARGAWGAGFLTGWQKQFGERRVFDLVTGVSVGALLATHTFIGDYDGLEATMSTIQNRDVFRKRIPVLWPLYASSRYHNGPLYRTLSKAIGPEELTAVAHRPEPGLLCVATVEMRSGELVKWNLTGIADKFVEAQNETEKTEWLELYRKVLVAATSVPGAFPPQQIVMPGFDATTPLPFEKESWHIDAGVRAQVFGDVGNQELVNLYADFLERIEEKDVSNRLAPAEIILVINNSSSVSQDWRPPKRTLLPLFQYAGRSLSVILNQTARDSQERIVEGVRHKLGEPGDGRWHLHIASMSEDELLGCSSLEFNCANRYFRGGEQRGRELTWDKTPEKTSRSRENKSARKSTSSVKPLAPQNKEPCQSCQT